MGEHKRGAYSRGQIEDIERRNRQRDYEQAEYRMLRAVNLACDRFLREHDINQDNEYHDNNNDDER
jgi:hypothetical protein